MIVFAQHIDWMLSIVLFWLQRIMFWNVAVLVLSGKNMNCMLIFTLIIANLWLWSWGGCLLHVIHQIQQDFLLFKDWSWTSFRSCVFCDQNKLVENLQDMCQSSFFYFVVKYIDFNTSDVFLTGNCPCSKSWPPDCPTIPYYLNCRHDFCGLRSGGGSQMRR